MPNAFSAPHERSPLPIACASKSGSQRACGGWSRLSLGSAALIRLYLGF